MSINPSKTGRALRRAGILTAATATLIGMASMPALAHVTVHPDHAEQGSYAKLTFRVPNEQDDASTTEIKISMPTDTPIPSVSVQPRPGWSYEIDKTTLPEPIQTNHGPVSKVVDTITWTAKDSDAAIQPGQFDEFALSAAPLPEKASTLRFPAIQTYSNGDDVRWIETAAPGAPEPDHPAPTLQLATTEHDSNPRHDGAGTTHNDDSADTVTLALSIAALVIALGAAGTAGYTARRRS